MWRDVFRQWRGNEIGGERLGWMGGKAEALGPEVASGTVAPLLMASVFQGVRKVS